MSVSNDEERPMRGGYERWEMKRFSVINKKREGATGEPFAPPTEAIISHK